MPTDLYAILRVPKGASADRIRKAYRKLALAHHPDRGGDAATFQAATEAHDVLSDPEKRARYDATGQVDARPAPHPQADVMALLTPLLAAVLEGMVKQGADPKHEHVVEHLRRSLREVESKVKADRAEALRLKAGVEASVARFTCYDGEENLLAAAARTHLAQVEQRLKKIEEHAARVTKAVEYLKTCGYKVDPRGPGLIFGGTFAAGGASGCGGWGFFSG